MFKRLASLLLAVLAVSACTSDKTATAATDPAAAKPAAAPAAAAAAPTRDWQLGADYFLIDPRVPTTTGDKIEVVEVFSYACPHCAHFQPTMDELKAKLPANAQLVLVPAVFNPQWEPFARAFYTARALGVLDKTHNALFEALHTQHQPLYSIESLAGFYANYGVDPKSFLATAQSFVIDSQIANGNNLVKSYGVSSTPTLVINGKYRVEMNAENKIGPNEALEIALMLVKQEAAAKK
ncbi:thiol:disulfide interchange protein DsbA/DsbL [Rudaea sp.]|uniref:thiol:disulfide interchange protein DsbA/DsbL n=1 Tax=Rudaea sp. TaxID=2136325 RepID=UPI003220638A